MLDVIKYTIGDYELPNPLPIRPFPLSDVIEVTLQFSDMGALQEAVDAIAGLKDQKLMLKAALNDTAAELGYFFIDWMETKIQYGEAQITVQLTRAETQ